VTCPNAVSSRVIHLVFHRHQHNCSSSLDSIKLVYQHPLERPSAATNRSARKQVTVNESEAEEDPTEETASSEGGFHLVVRPPTPMPDELNDEGIEVQWVSSESHALLEEESNL
jgi:hypothetical protein